MNSTSDNTNDENAIEHVLRALGMAEESPATLAAQKEPEPEKASDWFNKGNALKALNKYDMGKAKESGYTG